MQRKLLSFFSKKLITRGLCKVAQGHALKMIDLTFAFFGLEISEILLVSFLDRTVHSKGLVGWGGGNLGTIFPTCKISQLKRKLDNTLTQTDKRKENKEKKIVCKC